MVQYRHSTTGSEQVDSQTVISNQLSDVDLRVLQTMGFKTVFNLWRVGVLP